MKPIKKIMDVKKKESKRSKEERIAEQMGLIAGFDEDGETLLTLKQLLERKIAILAELNEIQKRNLTKERIKAQEEYKIVIIQDGKPKEYDKEEAIKEIEDDTEFGKQLVKIEMRAVEFAFKQAMKQNRNGD